MSKIKLKGSIFMSYSSGTNEEEKQLAIFDIHVEPHNILCTYACI